MVSSRMKVRPTSLSYERGPCGNIKHLWNALLNKLCKGMLKKLGSILKVEALIDSVENNYHDNQNLHIYPHKGKCSPQECFIN